MALSKKDLQLIAETLQPKFDQLRDELRYEFRTELRKEIKGILAGINALKRYMEMRFNNVERRIERLEKHPYLLRDSNT